MEVSKYGGRWSDIEICLIPTMLASMRNVSDAHLTRSPDVSVGPHT